MATKGKINAFQRILDEHDNHIKKLEKETQSSSSSSSSSTAAADSSVSLSSSSPENVIEQYRTTKVYPAYLQALESDPVAAAKGRVVKNLWEYHMYKPLGILRKMVQTAIMKIPVASASGASFSSATELIQDYEQKAQRLHSTVQTYTQLLEQCIRILFPSSSSSSPSTTDPTHHLILRNAVFDCYIYIGDLHRYAAQFPLHYRSKTPITTTTSTTTHEDTSMTDNDQVTSIVTVRTLSTDSFPPPPTDWTSTIRYYTEASLLRPSSGHPHNQFGVTAKTAGCDALQAYHYIRALASQEPYNGMNELLVTFFEGDNRVLVEALSKDPRTHALGAVSARQLQDNYYLAVIRNEDVASSSSSSRRGNHRGRQGREIQFSYTTNGGTKHQSKGTVLSKEEKTTLIIVDKYDSSLAVFGNEDVSAMIPPCVDYYRALSTRLAFLKPTAPVRSILLTWTLARYIRLVGMVHNGVSLEELPKLLKEVLRDIRRLLRASTAPVGGNSSTTGTTLSSSSSSFAINRIGLSSMWLVRLLSMAIFAVEAIPSTSSTSATASTPNGTVTDEDRRLQVRKAYGMLTILHTAAVAAQVARDIFDNAVRRQTRKQRKPDAKPKAESSPSSSTKIAKTTPSIEFETDNAIVSGIITINQTESAVPTDSLTDTQPVQLENLNASENMEDTAPDKKDGDEHPGSDENEEEDNDMEQDNPEGENRSDDDEDNKSQRSGNTHDESDNDNDDDEEHSGNESSEDKGDHTDESRTKNSHNNVVLSPDELSTFSSLLSPVYIACDYLLLHPQYVDGTLVTGKLLEMLATAEAHIYAHHSLSSSKNSGGKKNSTNTAASTSATDDKENPWDTVPDLRFLSAFARHRFLDSLAALVNRLERYTKQQASSLSSTVDVTMDDRSTDLPSDFYLPEEIQLRGFSPLSSTSSTVPSRYNPKPNSTRGALSSERLFLQRTELKAMQGTEDDNEDIAILSSSSSALSAQIFRLRSEKIIATAFAFDKRESCSLHVEERKRNASVTERVFVTLGPEAREEASIVRNNAKEAALTQARNKNKQNSSSSISQSHQSKGNKNKPVSSSSPSKKHRNETSQRTNEPVQESVPNESSSSSNRKPVKGSTKKDARPKEVAVSRVRPSTSGRALWGVEPSTDPKPKTSGNGTKNTHDEAWPTLQGGTSNHPPATSPQPSLLLNPKSASTSKLNDKAEIFDGKNTLLSSNANPWSAPALGGNTNNNGMPMGGNLNAFANMTSMFSSNSSFTDPNFSMFTSMPNPSLGSLFNSGTTNNLNTLGGNALSLSLGNSMNMNTMDWMSGMNSMNTMNPNPFASFANNGTNSFGNFTGLMGIPNNSAITNNNNTTTNGGNIMNNNPSSNGTANTTTNFFMDNTNTAAPGTLLGLNYPSSGSHPQLTNTLLGGGGGGFQGYNYSNLGDTTMTNTNLSTNLNNLMNNMGWYMINPGFTNTNNNNGNTNGSSTASASTVNPAPPPLLMPTSSSSTGSDSSSSSSSSTTVA